MQNYALYWVKYVAIMIKFQGKNLQNPYANCFRTAIVSERVIQGDQSRWFRNLEIIVSNSNDNSLVETFKLHACGLTIGTFLQFCEENEMACKPF